MSIDNKITMNTGWLNRTRRAAKNVGAALALVYVTTVTSGCLFDPYGTGGPGQVQVGEVDGGTQSTDLDHPEEDGGVTDGGADGGDAGCNVPDHELPTTVYNTISFENTDDLEQDILNYRIPSSEGGLTFGQLFDHDTALGYGEHGFADVYQNEQAFKDALTNDLGSKVSELICSSEPSDVQNAVSQLFMEIFNDGDDLTDFRLAGTNSVYFTKAVGNDSAERSYMVMIGAVVPTDGQTSGTPTVLYLSGMDETLAFIQPYTEGGI